MSINWIRTRRKMRKKACSLPQAVDLVLLGRILLAEQRNRLEVQGDVLEKSMVKKIDQWFIGND